MNLLKKVNLNYYVNTFVFIMSLYIILRYSLDLKIVYPENFLDLYEEPIIRFILYLLLFIISNYNITIAILLFIIIIFLELDYILFIKD